MSFEGLSPELMLCVRIRRERLWCSRPASKRSRQVLRRLVDQTAWDPNLGSRRVLRPILPRTEVSERQPPFRQDARTQIDRPSRDVRTHRAKENTCDNHFARCFVFSRRRRRLILSREHIREGGAGHARGETRGVQGGLHALSCAVRPCRRRLPKVVTTRRGRSAVICLLRD